MGWGVGGMRIGGGGLRRVRMWTPPPLRMQAPPSLQMRRPLPLRMRRPLLLRMRALPPLRIRTKMRTPPLPLRMLRTCGYTERGYRQHVVFNTEKTGFGTSCRHLRRSNFGLRMSIFCLLGSSCSQTMEQGNRARIA